MYFMILHKALSRLYLSLMIRTYYEEDSTRYLITKPWSEHGSTFFLTNETIDWQENWLMLLFEAHKKCAAVIFVHL